MGEWSLVIEGMGACGNGSEVIDADRMGAEFVDILRRNGQKNVKGFFLYGPGQLASQAERTMRRSAGQCIDKMAIPLAPLCDHRTHHSDRSGGWAEPCRSPAVIAQAFGTEVVTLRCVEHDIPLLNPSYRKLTVAGWKEAA